MARPSVLTEDFIPEFAAIVRRSGSIETAIKRMGIGRETYFGWQRRVRSGKGSRLEKRLVREVDEALGEVKERNEMLVQTAAAKNWVAAAWWLHRRFPDEYAPVHEKIKIPEQPDSKKQITRVQWADPPLPEDPTPDTSSTVPSETTGHTPASGGSTS